MMTNKLNGLLLDFASRAPENFAKTLEESSTAELTTILDQLPDASAAAVLARLPSHMLDKLLTETSPNHMAWISKSSLDDAKSILVRLPSTRRSTLVRRLPGGSQKVALQQFLSYPNHSLGRYVSNEVIIIPETMMTEELLKTLRANSPGLPVVVVDRDGRYVGLLDARQVISVNSNQPARKYANPVTPLNAELPLVDAMKATQWQWHSVLAAVDHSRHVLGIITREKLLQSLASAPEPHRPFDTVISIFALYVKALVGLLDSLFRIRDR